MKYILRKMTNLVLAVLFLATGLINCDTSKTVKGVHKHTFLIYTETKSKKNGGLDSIGWPDSNFGDSKWSFDDTGNLKKFSGDSDIWKWADKGSGPSDIGSWQFPEMGPMNFNKQDMQTSGMSSYSQDMMKQAEEYDSMRKLLLGMGPGEPPTTTLDQSKGVMNLRPIIAEDMKKMVATDEDRSEEDMDSLEEYDGSDEDSDQEENSSEEEKEPVMVRNIKTKQIRDSPKLCPEDVVYLEHVLGMRPMKYKFIEMGKIGKPQGRRGRKLVSGSKGSDLRNTRSKNKTRTTRAPFMQKLHSLFRNNGNKFT